MLKDDNPPISWDTNRKTSVKCSNERDFAGVSWDYAIMKQSPPVTGDFDL